MGEGRVTLLQLPRVPLKEFFTSKKKKNCHMTNKNLHRALFNLNQFILDISCDSHNSPVRHDRVNPCFKSEAQRSHNYVQLLKKKKTQAKSLNPDPPSCH